MSALPFTQSSMRYPVCNRVEDPIQQVRVAFANFSGLTIELIEPASERSPIDQSLKKGIKAFAHLHRGAFAGRCP